MTFHNDKNENDKKVCEDFLRGIFDFKKIFCLSNPGLIFIFTKKACLIPKQWGLGLKHHVNNQNLLLLQVNK
jgi:hypothetical protein